MQEQSTEKQESKLSSKEQEALHAKAVEDIRKFQKDLKQMSKNDLVRMVIGLSLDLQKYQVIAEHAQRLKDKSNQPQEGAENV